MADRAESRSLLLSIPSAAKLMGIIPERLTRAIAAHQICAIQIGSRKLVARTTIERLPSRSKGSRVNLVTPKPGASDWFGISADVVRRLERMALMLGAMVDIVRGLTVCPLTAS